MFLAFDGLTARRRVSVAGMVRPAEVSWLVYEGTVLCTSRTSIFDIASSVQGSGSVELTPLPTEAFVMFA
jgi:hypothetical protein